MERNVKKAFVLAAGLGTRLKPFTLTNPKALVPVGGVPMLERVLLRLKSEGFEDVVINVHHFADKVEAFVRENNFFGMRIRFSNEREQLLDTGGGIYHARKMLEENDAPFLIHNVDILSNAPLSEMMRRHSESGNDATLLVSDRDSSRKLIFSKSNGVESERESRRDESQEREQYETRENHLELRGWHNLQSDEYRPEGFMSEDRDVELAFSGIHIMSPRRIFARMEEMARQRGDAFSVIDFYLANINELGIRGYDQERLQLIDIGKPATLSQANRLFD